MSNKRTRSGLTSGHHPDTSPFELHVVLVTEPPAGIFVPLRILRIFFALQIGPLVILVGFNSHWKQLLLVGFASKNTDCPEKKAPIRAQNQSVCLLTALGPSWRFSRKENGEIPWKFLRPKRSQFHSKVEFLEELIH